MKKKARSESSAFSTSVKIKHGAIPQYTVPDSMVPISPPTISLAQIAMNKENSVMKKRPPTLDLSKETSPKRKKLMENLTVEQKSNLCSILQIYQIIIIYIYIFI